MRVKAEIPICFLAVQSMHECYAPEGNDLDPRRG